MDGFLVLLGLACTALSFGLPLYAAWASTRAMARTQLLEREVRTLQDRITMLELAASSRPAVTADAPLRRAAPPAPVSPPAPRSSPVVTEPATDEVTVLQPAITHISDALPAVITPTDEPAEVTTPEVTAPEVTAPEVTPAVIAPAAAPPPPPPPPASPPLSPWSGPDLSGMQLENLGLRALSIAGGALLIMAMLFGFREVVRAGWVGPVLRFALGVGLGLGLWAGAERLRARRYGWPAAALNGAGTAALYGVLYAGHARYGLLSQPVTFGLMVGVTLVTVLTAVAHKSRLEVWLGAIGGFLTPILLSTGENKALAFFSYLALLNIGLIAAAWRRGWWDVVLGAGLSTAVMYLGWTVSFRAPDQVWIGLVAPLLLGGLHLYVAARATGTLQHIGYATTTLLWATALPFLIPTDPLRADPTNGTLLRWDLSMTAWWAVGYLLLLTGVLSWLGRQSIVKRVASSVVPILMSMVFAIAWTGYFTSDTISPDAMVLLPALVGLLGVQVLGSALSGPGWGWLLFLIGGLFGGLAVVGIASPVGPLLGLLVLVPGLTGAVLGWWRGPRIGLAAGLAAGAAILNLVSADGLTEEVNHVLLPTLGLYAFYAWPPFLSRRPAEPVAIGVGALTGVALFLPLWRVWQERLGAEAIGLLPLILGASTLLGVIALIRLTRARIEDNRLSIPIMVVLLFVALAVPLQLERAWLTMGWAIEVALLGLLYRRIKHQWIITFSGVLSAAVVIRLIFNPAAWTYGGAQGPLFFNWILYTWGLPAVALLIAAWALSSHPWLARAQRLAAVGLLFGLLNLEIAHAFATDDRLSFASENLGQEMTRSISWAIFGLSLIMLGSVRESRNTRLLGLLFALLSIVKVALMDVWLLSGFYRVGSFAGIAVALLLAAIAFQRLILQPRPPTDGETPHPPKEQP